MFIRELRPAFGSLGVTSVDTILKCYFQNCGTHATIFGHSRDVDAEALAEVIQLYPNLYFYEAWISGASTWFVLGQHGLVWNHG